MGVLSLTERRTTQFKRERRRGRAISGSSFGKGKGEVGENKKGPPNSSGSHGGGGGGSRKVSGKPSAKERRAEESRTKGEGIPLGRTTEDRGKEKGMSFFTKHDQRRPQTSGKGENISKRKNKLFPEGGPPCKKVRQERLVESPKGARR